MPTESKVAETMALIAETWSSAKVPTDGAIKLWTGILADMTDEELERAFYAYARDTEKGKFPPSPSDLLGAIKGDTNDQIEEFVGEVLAKIDRGAYRVYSPRGSRWDTRKLREDLGADVLAAFTEAGGAVAFDDIESSKYALKKLGELLRAKSRAGVRSGRFDPARAIAAARAVALPPPPRSLPPAPTQGDLTPEEAEAALKRIRAKIPTPPVQTATSYEERMELLNRQRDQLLEEAGNE